MDGKIKFAITPLVSHFKLSASKSPGTDEEKEYMPRGSYQSVIESLIYTMVCTRLDLS